MIITYAMSPEWLSNTWLVADKPGGSAVIVDAGAPTERILEKIERLRLNVTHVLLTHHHGDHTANASFYRQRLGARVCGHEREAQFFRGLDLTLRDGQTIATGDLRIRVLHIPGHTLGQSAFVMNDERVFTGDTLFRGSVGGTRAPGHTTFEDLQHSIMRVLMALPHSFPVHPGHMGPTTIGQEWETNPFIRLWRGLDEPAAIPCTSMGRRATLLLRAPDYDGGTKCWVRFADDGMLDVVPGSVTKEVREMAS